MAEQQDAELRVAERKVQEIDRQLNIIEVLIDQPNVGITPEEANNLLREQQEQRDRLLNQSQAARADILDIRDRLEREAEEKADIERQQLPERLQIGVFRQVPAPAQERIRARQGDQLEDIDVGDDAFIGRRDLVPDDRIDPNVFPVQINAADAGFDQKQQQEEDEKVNAPAFPADDPLDARPLQRAHAADIVIVDVDPEDEEKKLRGALPHIFGEDLKEISEINNLNIDTIKRIALKFQQEIDDVVHRGGGVQLRLRRALPQACLL